MATSQVQADMRKVVSPRPKGRDSKDTLCRNVLIYGHCRYEDRGCAFNHDQSKTMASQQPDGSKKALNVESPAFTPSALQSSTKKSTFSSQAASATPFTPRAGDATTTATQAERETPTFNPASIRDFTPSNYDLTNVDSNLSFDPYSLSSVGQGIPATHFNPYAAAEHGNLDTSAGGAFFAGQGGYNAPPQPTQYHLYAPSSGIRREDLLPYQRMARDFFLDDKTREQIQKRMEAALQVLPGSQLPHVEHYHSLVPLDLSNNRKLSTLFGLPSWLYKAFSSKNGNIYCIRRLEGFKLTNEQAILSVRAWKMVISANIVSVHDAFTTRAFGDSSLIFVTDYHPLAKTLLEAHFPQTNSIQGARSPAKIRVTEPLLWSYIVQIANALKAIHSANLAARSIDLSKIIVTERNRIRLSGCSVLDVIKFDKEYRSLQDYQQEDFEKFGKVILALAVNSPHINIGAALEQLAKTYTEELYETVKWLIAPAKASAMKRIGDFIRGISTHIVDQFDSEAHAFDSITADLAREVENGRIFRLVAKLGVVNERGEFDRDPEWSETGERYLLKLFRDYVFHQVDSQGKPMVDLGHIIRCLNKLDAGIDEKVCLTSRDSQTAFVVTYRDLKKALSSAFTDLTKGHSNAARAF